MKILVTGIHGQVGFELLRSLQPFGDIIPADRALMDLAKPDEIRRFIRAQSPELIVNAGAYTAVDKAESDVELCHAINATAVGVLGEEAEALGAAVLHFSTDYVFDGSGDMPFTEDAATAPLNVYGASKLAGEQLLAAACSQHLILRTSWVYGMRGSNFLLTMLRLSQSQSSIKVVADQIGAPTWCRFIAERTAALVALYVQRKRDGTDQEIRTTVRCPPRVMHLANGGATSWAHFAREIFLLAGRSTVVEEIPASAWPTAARRPHNSRLDCSRLERVLGVPMEPWQVSLERCLKGE